MSELIELDWLLRKFTRDLSGVAYAALISVDGLTMAVSADMDEESESRTAAATAAVSGLAASAAGLFSTGRVLRCTVEMAHRYFLLMSVGDGSQLVAVAEAECDIGQVVYEMTLLVERVGSEIQALPR